MSRLFLATERSLNRQVVIKVLAPELASPTAAARFRREIDILATLQHPHILPMLGADTDARSGLLFYVMPYVAGESLRHRLVRDGRLSMTAAVQVLREAADALAYAHRQGVVHRDIKPENILLVEDHAMVADFGIARALVTAAGGGLTGTGLSVGTPGYMSPEQVAGEPTVDARADIYALAVVGYEMLVGRPPFEGASAQALLAAHMRDTPASPRTVRPEVPRTVSDAIMQALAKDPDARFQNAGAFRDALGAAPFGRTRRRSWPAVAAVTAGILLLGAATATLLTRRSAEGPLDASLLAVAPFEVLAPDLQLWHEGLVDVFSRDLDGAGALRTVAPSVVMRGWSGRADPVSAAALGRQTGAGLAVFGTLQRAGADSVRLSLTVLDVASQRPLGELERRDAASRMDRLVDSAAVAVIRLLSGSRAIGAPRLSAVGTRSLAALKEFLQGEQLYRRADLDSAEAHYRRALAIDSTFALAYHAISNSIGWSRYGNPNGFERAAPYSYHAGAFNHGLGARDSMLILADSLFFAISEHPGTTDELPRVRRILSVTERLAREYATDPAVLYEYADVRYHFGSALTGVSDQEVFDAFAQAIAADSAYGPAYLHAIPLAFALGGERLGRHYAGAFSAHVPRGPYGSAVRLWLALSQAPDVDSAALRQVLDTSDLATLEQIPRLFLTAPDSLELAVRAARRVQARTRSLPGTDAATAENAMNLLRETLIYHGHLAEAARMPHIEESGYYDALARLGGVPADTARLTYASMFAPPWPAWSCLGGVIGLWVAVGDTASIARCARAVRTSAPAWAAPGDPRVDHLRPMMVAALGAYGALAGGDTAAAAAAFVALPDSLCAVRCPDALQVDRARVLAARGRAREALTLLSGRTVESSPFAVLRALVQARLAARLGERERAIDNYALVAGAWAHADSVLQPFVAEAHRELGRLGGDARASVPVMPDRH